MNHSRAVLIGSVALVATLLGLGDPIVASQADIDAQMKLLTGEDAKARQKAREALTAMGVPAIKSLLQAVDNENRSIAKVARMALHDIVAPTGRLGGEWDREAACAVLSAELNNANLPKKTREYICRLLSWVGREDSVRALAQAMHAKDIREMARWALSRNPTPAALDALHAALVQADPEFRVGLVNAIGAHKKRWSVPILTKELTHADEAVRIAAMGAIARIADPFGMDALRPRLKQGSAKEQAATRAAWLALAETLIDSGRPVAGNLMCAEALGWATSVQERCAAIYGIGKAGQPGAQKMLLNALKKAKHDDVRGTIAEALVAMPSPQVTKDIAATLTSPMMMKPSPSAQVTLLNVLATRKDKAGEPAAVAALKSKSAPVRVAALKCLAVIGTESAAPALAESLQRPAGSERNAAVFALGQLPAPNGLKWLYDEVNKPGLSDEYRGLLIEAISARNEPGSVEALSKLLATKQSEAIRIAAYNALGKIGQAAGLAPLLKGVDKEAGKDRDAAEAAMSKLEASATASMIKAADTGTPYQKVALLKVLGFRFDPGIKPVLLKGYASTDTRIKSAAIEGLRRMADPSTLSILQEAGEKGPAKGPAVAGMIRIAVKIEKDKRAEALRIYHRSLELATRDKEIKPALDRLAALADVSSFDVVRPFLTKGNARANAAEAVMATAVKLPDSRKADGLAALKTAVSIAPLSGRAKAAYGKLKAWGVDMDLARAAGFVTHWWVTGPFPSPDKKLFDAKLPPEDKVDLAGKFKVGGKEFGWKKVHIQDARGIGDLRKLVASADNVGCYAYAEVTSPKAQDVLIKIGSDDDVVCWLNGKKIHANKVSRGLSADQDVVKARLEKGVNRILLKVLNGGADWAMCLRITDRKDQSLRLEQRQK